MGNVQLGVIGSAQILSRSLFGPLQQVERLEVSGISSRTPGKAKAVAELYGVPRVFASYEQMLLCSDIEAVYIVLSNDLHAEWVIKAIHAGKHVLVEKPLCLNTRQAAQIEQAHAAGKVHLLEGMMVQHHPWQEAVAQMVQDERFGRLKQIVTRISLPSKEGHANNYRSDPAKGGGCFYDLGCYWLQFLQRVSGLSVKDYEGRSAFNGPNGCDWTFEAELRLESGVQASAVISFEQPYRSSHVLVFEYARVSIPDFFRALLGNLRIAVRIERNDREIVEQLLFEPQNYYANQLAFFRDVVEGKRTNLPIAWSFVRTAWIEKLYQSARAHERGKLASQPQLKLHSMLGGE